MGFQTPLSIASEKICFEKPVAQKLLTEIKFGEITSDKLLICQQSYSSSRALNKIDKVVITDLTQDKADLSKLSDEYKQRYIKTNEQLTKCNTNVPSRMTWFSYGVISSLVLILASIFVLK